MKKEEILELAKYCLNCKNKPCSTGCPMETDIPSFIAKIRENKLEDAYKLVRTNNVLSHICSNICPHEKQCQGKCIRGIKGKPVSIGLLENYVNSWARENNVKLKIDKKEKNNIKIAIIGSGPAGLSCALELVKQGYEVTVFEKDEKLGGVLRYGIPEFRLNRELLDETILELINLGVNFKTNKELGVNLSFDYLNKNEYKAVFLGIGAQIAQMYKLSEQEYYNIYDSEEFLRKYNTNKKINDLGKTIIIGGGNVAIDCARVANKIGAKKTTVIYRRDRENMPARNEEIQDAINENIEIVYLSKVVKINGNNKKIKEVQCIKTKLQNNRVIDIPNSEFTIEADSVIFAIGLLPDAKLLKDKLNMQMENGLLKVTDSGETSIKGIFAGGDVTQNKATVCQAVSCGKKAAKSIMKYCDKK